MKTYFIRHGYKLDIDNKTHESIWNNNIIAIHFPCTLDSKEGDPDTKSLNPDEYKPSDKKAIKTLIELSNNGGYVCAFYDYNKECKIGYVEPKTKIEYITGMWGNINKKDGREAILKGLTLTKVKYLNKIESIRLLFAQPQQGTICRWHIIGDRVKNIIENIKYGLSYESLMPSEQEVLCSEYLRSNLASKYPFKCLASCVLPIGRTMKDIDIIGINEIGEIILAQVTHNSNEEISDKIGALEKYTTDNIVAHRIMFCNCKNYFFKNNIYYLPIRKVYDEFISTNIGKNWINIVFS